MSKIQLSIDSRGQERVRHDLPITTSVVSSTSAPSQVSPSHSIAIGSLSSALNSLTAAATVCVQSISSRSPCLAGPRCVFAYIEACDIFSSIPLRPPSLVATSRSVGWRESGKGWVIYYSQFVAEEKLQPSEKTSMQNFDCNGMGRIQRHTSAQTFLKSSLQYANSFCDLGCREVPSYRDGASAIRREDGTAEKLTVNPASIS